MAKGYKFATPICVGLSLLALIGIIIGIAKASPLIIIFFLLPTAVYEVYRTEGDTTRWASWGMLGVLLGEALLIFGNIKLDLAELLGETEKTIGGYTVPLGDVKVVGPAVIAILAVILFLRTGGRYTKWLAVIIFVTAFAVIYVIDPAVFKQLFKMGVEEGLERVR